MRIEGVRLVILGRYGNADLTVKDDAAPTSNIREYHAKWRARHREELRLRAKAWYHANKRTGK